MRGGGKNFSNIFNRFYTFFSLFHTFFQIFRNFSTTFDVFKHELARLVLSQITHLAHLTQNDELVSERANLIQNSKSSLVNSKCLFLPPKNPQKNPAANPFATGL
jgi:hypothetical protein